MKLVELKCNNCGSALSAPEENGSILVSNCKHCFALYALEGQASIPEPSLPPKNRRKVRRPKEFTVLVSDSALDIKQRWCSPHRLTLLTVLLAIELTALLAITIMLFSEGDQWGPSLWLFAAIVLIAMLATLTWRLNSTCFHVSNGYLSKKDRPIPGTSRSIKIAAAKQLYVQKTIRQVTNSHSNESPQFISKYKLYAISQKKSRRCLIAEFASAHHALYVEQQIEKFLQIKDDHVEGEI